MKARFSEFGYGYTVTEELVRAVRRIKPSVPAPFFPSLYKEGQSGFGYDMRLRGVPVFLQFKLSEYMKGTGAS